MFRRPTFPELHKAKERLLAVRMCGAEPAVAYDKKGLLSNHTAIIFIPWHELKGVKNKSIKKTAKYSKEVKPKETRPVVLREELEDLSRQFEPKYLLAVMNSSFAKNFVNERRRSKLDIYPDDWKPLPILPIPLEQQQVFVRLVDKILAQFGENAYPLPTNAAQLVEEVEHEIDERVDALYSAPPEIAETEDHDSVSTTSIPFA